MKKAHIAQRIKQTAQGRIAFSLFAFVLGALASYGFAPYGLWPVYLGCVCALFVLLCQARLLVGMFCCACFYLGFISVGFYWIVEVAENFMPNQTWRMLLSLLLFVCVLVVVWAVAGALIQSLCMARANRGFLLLVFASSAFAVADALRTVLLFDFSYLTAGHLVLPQFVLRAWLPLVGSVGVGFFVYLAAGMLAWCILRFTVGRACVVMVSAAVFCVMSLALSQVHYTDKQATQLTTQIIHGGFQATEKSTQTATVKRLELFTRIALANPLIDVTLWPESTVSIDLEGQLKSTMHALFARLKQQNKQLVFGGYPIVRSVKTNALLDADLEPLYSKQHLMPLTEFTPLGLAWLLDSNTNNTRDAIKRIDTPHTTTQFGDIHAHLSICYDLLALGRLAQDAREAMVLIHATDLSWFANTPAPGYLLARAQTLAMMTQKPLVYAANFGTSAFIDHTGELLASTQHANTAIHHSITPRIGMTPIQKIGGETTIVWALLLLLFVALAALLHQRRALR